MTLERSESGSASLETERTDWATVRSAVYTYYTGFVPDGSDDGSDPDKDVNGRLGDLKLAEVKDASGNTIDTSYYRYYKFTGEGHEEGFSFGPTNQSGSTGGPDPIEPSGSGGAYDVFIRSGLKSVTRGASFSRLAAAEPGYQSESDATIEPYVNNFFDYERWGDHVGVGSGGDNYNWRVGYRFGSQYRVTTEIAQGEGCSTCSGGLGTFKYEYFSKDGEVFEPEDPGGIGYEELDYNVWRMRTTEVFPDTTPGDDSDNDRSIAYTNELGLPMLTVLVDRNGTSGS